MAKKLKITYTGRILEQSDENFDWSLYDNGYTGGASLQVNPKVKVSDKKDLVFCHEPYAQELYDMMECSFRGKKVAAKDSIKGAMYEVTNVSAVSDHEISIDTNTGISTVIDLSKERQYLDYLGCPDAKKFTAAVAKSDEFRTSLLQSGLVAKVKASGRISLWEGTRARIEGEFMEQIRKKAEKPYAYRGRIVESNNGGYIVDVLGIRCFMPGSHASNGVITDFKSMIGTVLEVIPINFSQGMFVVSHKAYLEYVMPSLVAQQLYVGKEVLTKVTGLSRNGVFVVIKSDDDKWIFSGLIHRSRMTKNFEKDFDHKHIQKNDQLRVYIHEINETENEIRIVLGDVAPANSKDASQSLGDKLSTL